MPFRGFLLPLGTGLLLWALGPLLGEDLLLAFASLLFFGALGVTAGPLVDRLLALAVAEFHGLFGRLLQRRLGSLQRLVGVGRRLLRLLRLLRRLQPLLLAVSRLSSGAIFKSFRVTASVALGAAATTGGLLRQRLLLAAARQRLPAVLLLGLRRPLVA